LSLKTHTPTQTAADLSNEFEFRVMSRYLIKTVLSVSLEFGEQA